MIESVKLFQVHNIHSILCICCFFPQELSTPFSRWLRIWILFVCNGVFMLLSRFPMRLAATRSGVPRYRMSRSLSLPPFNTPNAWAHVGARFNCHFEKIYEELWIRAIIVHLTLFPAVGASGAVSLVRYRKSCLLWCYRWTVLRLH